MNMKYRTANLPEMVIKPMLMTFNLLYNKKSNNYFMYITNTYLVGPNELAFIIFLILCLALTTNSSLSLTLDIKRISRSSTVWKSRLSIQGKSVTLSTSRSINRQKKSQMSGNFGLNVISAFSTSSCCQ